jgi:hypothetical protein
MINATNPFGSSKVIQISSPELIFNEKGYFIADFAEGFAQALTPVSYFFSAWGFNKLSLIGEMPVDN